VIEDAPHGCLWTHADEVNKALLDFVTSDAVVSGAKTVAV
jgi:hypothetical protein